MWTCIECEFKFDESSGDLDERICDNCIEKEENDAKKI